MRHGPARVQIQKMGVRVGSGALRCLEAWLDGGEFELMIKQAGFDAWRIMFRYLCRLWAVIAVFCTLFFGIAVAHQRFGPEGFWQFDEGIGFEAVDISDHRNMGVLVNGPNWSTGRVGSALSFDGLDDYVDLGNAAALNPARQISIAVWIRTTTIDASQFIIAKDDSITGTLQYFLSVQGGGAVRFGIRTSADNFATTAVGSIGPNIWYHVVGVFNSVDMRVYINGILAGKRQTVPGTMVNNGVAARIGVRQDGASPFSGLIDEMRVYDRALTPNEVAALSSVGDSTPPVISAVSLSNVTAGSATISWITDEPADSRVEYGPTPAYGLTTALDPSLVSLHYKVLSNLLPGTTYNYRIASTDAAHNASASKNFTFTTIPVTSGPLGVVGESKFSETVGIRATEASGHRNTGSLVNSPPGRPAR